MGKSTERARASIAQYAANRQIQAAETRRQTTERQLAFEEQYLGSEAQLNGQVSGGLGTAELDYAGRYVLDEGAIGTFTYKDPWIGQSMRDKLKAANDQLDAAQQAAREGRLEDAAAYKAEAQALITRGNLGVTRDPAAFLSAFQYTEGENVTQARAQQQLQSPSALIVGKQLAEAKQFQDPNSEASIRQRGILTEGAQRSIAAQQRDSLRNNRDDRLASGQAFNAFGSQARSQRQSERFGAERAQVEIQASNIFEDFRRQYAKDTVGFAQAYLQGQAGIREQYQGALDSLAVTAAGLNQQNADRHKAFSDAAAQREAASKEQKAKTISLVAGIAIGAATGGLGAFAVGGSVLAGAASGAAGGAGRAAT